jgi:hypothetical protein
LGDKIDTGTSINWDSNLGIVSGVGYMYQHKFKDQYSAGASSKVLEQDTEQSAHFLDALVGYSSVKSYFRKETAVPFNANISYLRQLESRNLPVTHRWQLDTKVFF